MSHRAWCTVHSLVAAAGFACGGEAPADLIVVNADVRTADAGRARAEALAVRDGRFVAVGSRDEVEALAGRETRVVDASGATVLPGFVDGHVHLESGISLVRGVNLYGVRGKDEWLRIVAGRAAELPEGTWIVGGRWDHTLEPGGAFPTRQDLDRVVPNHPVALSDVDGHSTWANSLALEIGGVTRDTPDPPGGGILRDAGGEPTGILLETAGGLVRRHVPALSEVERREALRETIAYANRLGITAVHNMSGLGSLDDYRALMEDDAFSIRMWYGATGAADRLDALAALRDSVRGASGAEREALGPRLEIGYVKLVADGVLSSRTAALFEPYADDAAVRGLPRYEQGELNDVVRRANAAGFPVAIHAIGDRAVAMSLDAFAAAADVRDAIHTPNRIEHIEVLRPDDAARFAALGVLASMNPHHCITGIDVYNTDRVGEERAAWTFPWGGLRDAGATLVFGSDWATAPLDPLHQLYAAALREKPAGGPAGGWHPEHRLTFDEALRGYTLAGAEAAGWGDEIGSIVAGKLADFVVLDGPLPEPFDAGVLDRRVRATFLGGRAAYEAVPR